MENTGFEKDIDDFVIKTKKNCNALVRNRHNIEKFGIVDTQRGTSFFYLIYQKF